MPEGSFDKPNLPITEGFVQELPKPRIYPSVEGYISQRFANRQALSAFEMAGISRILSITGYDTFLPAAGVAVNVEGFVHEGHNIAVLTSTPQNGDPRIVNIIEVGDVTDYVNRRGEEETTILGIVLENSQRQCTDLLELIPSTTRVAYRTDEFVARVTNEEERLSLEHHPKRKIVVPPIATNRASLPAKIFNDFTARHPEIFNPDIRYWDIDRIALLHEMSHDLLNNVGMRRTEKSQVGDIVLEAPITTTEVEVETKDYTTRLYQMFKNLGFNLAPKLTDTQVDTVQQEFIASYESGTQQDIEKRIINQLVVS